MGPARKKWGQHWLASDRLAANLVDRVQPASGDRFLEIGPGRGRLTRALLEHPVRVVVAVEIDPACVELLQPLVAGSEGRLRVQHGDVLEADEWIPWQQGPFRFVGNLPYNVSSPILRWTAESRRRLQDAHYMLQLEVAERLTAPVGTRSYAYLSVLIRSCFEVEILQRLSPGAFRPEPAVESAFVRLLPLPGAPRDDGWLRVPRAAFAHRRKKLANALVLGGWSKERVLEACAAAKVDPGSRAERLEPDAYLRLADALGGAS